MSDLTTFTIYAPAGSIYYPAIYDPRPMFSDNPPDFTCSVPFDLLPSSLRETVVVKHSIHHGVDLATLKSKARPEVSVEGLNPREGAKWLIEEQALLTARNVSFNMLFIENACVIAGEVYEVRSLRSDQAMTFFRNKYPEVKYLLGLKSIYIDRQL